ncbi:hypothetical protein [Streptomyces sp. NPDC059819]|uniref:hypothetical protein n=1 Tax=Streptomyces sp. NPDC059819 TaxID=3346963 RepID=UPI0036482300
MNHILPSTMGPRRRNRSSSPAGDGVPRTATEFAALYDDHAHPLYMLAHLLCQDGSTADAVFVVAMSKLGTRPGALASDPRTQRRHLAAGLWQAVCSPPADGPRPPTRAPTERGGPGTHESAGAAAQPPPVQPPPACTTQEALLGLTLLGGHTYQEAAHLIGLAPDAAARQLRAALVTKRRQAGSPRADRATSLPSTPTPTADARGAGARGTGARGRDAAYRTEPERGGR